MKTILVTGGAGFIGSNFIPFYLEKHKDNCIVNMDKLTYAGNLDNLKELEDNERYIFARGDICNMDLVENIFFEHDIRGVIHFAAESHVDNSISGPGIFIETNVKGTFSLLESARRKWMSKPFIYKNNYQDCRFLHISTDEVYGSLGETGLFTEETRYAPNSPYSASKASSDLIVRSYFHTYGFNAIITNCSNNYGPKQHKEKLIPTIIRNALYGNPIPIYGDGKNIRDWLYVLDHCYGIDLAFNKGINGATYNIGGGNEKRNIDIAQLICKILDEYKPSKNKLSYTNQITYVEDRPGHDRRYAIDANKIQKELGWQPFEDFESGLKKTIKWYLDTFETNNILA